MQQFLDNGSKRHCARDLLCRFELIHESHTSTRTVGVPRTAELELESILYYQNMVDYLGFPSQT